MKCRKTILNRFEDEKVFSFGGAKSFIDTLRKKGDGSIDVYDGFANRDLYAVNYDDMSGDYTQIVSVESVSAGMNPAAP